jgi:hypothetical protein
MMIASIPGHTFLELFVREMGDQFREHEPASMHPPLSAGAPIRSPHPLLSTLDFKSFPPQKTATLNDRKGLKDFIKYFTGH